MAFKQLDFWIKINKLAIRTCREHLEGRYLIVNFNRLCDFPDAEVSRLIGFLGIEADPELFNRLTEIPVAPPGNARYLKEDLSPFTADQLRGVRELGYDTRPAEVNRRFYRSSPHTDILSHSNADYEQREYTTW